MVSMTTNQCHHPYHTKTYNTYNTCSGVNKCWYTCNSNAQSNTLPALQYFAIVNIMDTIPVQE